MNTAPKFNLSVKVAQATKVLFDGIAHMDAVFPILPTEGRFTVSFKHENLRGFAKMLYWLNAAGNLIGAKVTTKAKSSWRDLAITGQDIPEVISVEFSSKAAAVSAIYCAWICCMVQGNWKKFPEDSQASFEIWLSHIQQNGIEMFLNTGRFCSGRLIPLKKSDVKAKAAVVEAIMTAKKELSGTKGKAPVKAKAEAKPKAKAKVARKPKPDAKTTEPTEVSAPAA